MSIKRVFDAHYIDPVHLAVMQHWFIICIQWFRRNPFADLSDHKIGEYEGVEDVIV
jgi:hypothetical protein